MHCILFLFLICFIILLHAYMFLKIVLFSFVCFKVNYKINYPVWFLTYFLYKVSLYSSDWPQTCHSPLSAFPNKGILGIYHHILLYHFNTLFCDIFPCSYTIDHLLFIAIYHPIIWLFHCLPMILLMDL